MDNLENLLYMTHMYAYLQLPGYTMRYVITKLYRQFLDATEAHVVVAWRLL